MSSGEAELGHRVPERFGARPLRADVGVQLALLVGRDRDHGRIDGDLARFVGRQHGGEAVDGVLVREGDLDGATDGALHAVDERDLLLDEVLAVLAGGGARSGSSCSPAGGAVGARPGVPPVVGGHGGVGEADEERLRLVAGRHHRRQLGTAIEALGRGDLGRLDVVATVAGRAWAMREASALRFVASPGVVIPTTAASDAGTAIHRRNRLAPARRGCCGETMVTTPPVDDGPHDPAPESPRRLCHAVVPAPATLAQLFRFRRRAGS